MSIDEVTRGRELAKLGFVIVPDEELTRCPECLAYYVTHDHDRCPDCLAYARSREEWPDKYAGIDREGFAGDR